MADDLQPFHSPADALLITEYIVGISNLAYNLGVGSYSNWRNQIADKRIETRSTFHGDPMRFTQGLHSTTLQVTTTYNPYIDFLYSIVTNTPQSNVAGVIHEETIDEYSKLTPLLGIPSVQSNESYAPVMITLDWDTALVDPYEIKPMYKFFNVVEGARSSYVAIINHACTQILRKFGRDAIFTFSAYGNQEGGTANLIRWMKQNGTISSTDLIEGVRKAEQNTGLIGQIINRIHRQVTTRIDQMSLVLAMCGGVKYSDTNNYTETTHMYDRFDALKARCLAENTKIVYMPVSSKKTYFRISGPTATVTTINSSINEAGGTSHVSKSKQSVLSESLLKFSSPLKRNVQWPASEDDQPIVFGAQAHMNKIQIPTTNWTDVRRVHENCPTFVTQYSKSYTFIADDVRAAVKDFYASSSDLGIRTASMSFDANKGRGTYDVSYVSAH